MTFHVGLGLGLGLGLADPKLTPFPNPPLQARLLELLLVANEEFAQAEARCAKAEANEKKVREEGRRILMDRGAAELMALAVEASMCMSAIYTI